jgi:BspA type Leucine rich repeat region (6 copies)
MPGCTQPLTIPCGIDKIRHAYNVSIRSKTVTATLMKTRASHCRLFLLAALVFGGLIQSATAQFTFITNNGAITITAYAGSGPSVTIPAATNGFPVTRIGNAAFGGNASLTSVTIPDSVTNIGAFAFSSSGLTGITIPGGVIGVGQDAFESCDSLTNVSVNATNAAYSSLNGVLFDKALAVLIQYPPALAAGSYTVPGSVSTIASDAFFGASGVSNVIMPGSVSSIGNDAFAYCFALSSVYFSGNAPNVGSAAFYETGFGSGITVYYLPGTTGWTAFSGALGPSLAASMFWYLPNPEIISFGSSFGVQNSQFGFIISWATNSTLVVDACTNLTNPAWLPISTNFVAATNGTANFADPQWSSFSTRFYRLQLAPSSFGYTTMNGAITITGYTGFSPSISIPATINSYPVVAIGNTAFGGDTGVTGVTIPNSVTNIGSFAFAGSGLSTITIPGSVIGIGQNAFAACDSLADISVSAGNPAYSSLNGVLFDKAQDTLIQFPLALNTYNYTIPGSVNTIADNAFYGASGFASVTIPKSVTSIGDDAFAFCYAQNNYYLQVYFEGNAPNIGNFAFYSDGFGGFTGNYLPGTTGWNTFSGATDGSLASLDLWYQPQPEVLNFEPSFGMKNGLFGFTISWATNASVIVDACTNLANPAWLPVSTNIVTLASGMANFSDPKSNGYSRRYYRLRSP